EAQHATLETGTRDALLRLRALRDGGDLRAAGWIIAGYGSANPRVRSEAVLAMHEVTNRFRAACYRWADDFDVTAYRAFVAPYLEAARRLANDANPWVRAFAATLLSVEADGA